MSFSLLATFAIIGYIIYYNLFSLDAREERMGKQLEELITKAIYEVVLKHPVEDRKLVAEILIDNLEQEYISSVNFASEQSNIPVDNLLKIINTKIHYARVRWLEGDSLKYL